MTLIQLKYAIIIAEGNSFNEAAKKLFISQPSLSATIHSMEKEIGFEIFLRSQPELCLHLTEKNLLAMPDRLFNSMICWMPDIWKRLKSRRIQCFHAAFIPLQLCIRRDG